MKMSRKKRAQVAIEFVILVGLLFFVMLLFLAFIRNYVVDVRSDKDRELLKDIAYAVQAEVHIAAGADDGYRRDFEVPVKIDSMNYTISIIEDEVWAQTEKAEVVLNIPSIVGNLTMGDNTIRNDEGVIYLNVGGENDTDPPSVTLVSPPDSSSEPDNDITFIYWTSDIDSGIENCSLIFNQEKNQSDNSVDEGVWQYFNLYNVSSGTHNWTINCTDNSPNNNSAQADAWSFNV